MHGFDLSGTNDLCFWQLSKIDNILHNTKFLAIGILENGKDKIERCVNDHNYDLIWEDNGIAQCGATRELWNGTNYMTWFCRHSTEKKHAVVAIYI